MALTFECSDTNLWKQALSSYKAQIESLSKSKSKPKPKPGPDLTSLDNFYTCELPGLIQKRSPSPYVTVGELSKLMQWKLSRGKWRPRLLSFVQSLNDDVVKSASEKAFKALPDVSKAVSELTVLKGVGPATASAVLAAYAPEIAPFMSDEAMEAAIGNSKDYTLKQYLVFVEKLQDKAKELTGKGDLFTPSDVERALWSAVVGAKSKASPTPSVESHLDKKSKRKRKR